jgi:hypothetical protein
MTGQFTKNLHEREALPPAHVSQLKFPIIVLLFPTQLEHL